MLGGEASYLYIFEKTTFGFPFRLRFYLEELKNQEETRGHFALYVNSHGFTSLGLHQNHSQKTWILNFSLEGISPDPPPFKIKILDRTLVRRYTIRPVQLMKVWYCPKCILRNAQYLDLLVVHEQVNMSLSSSFTTNSALKLCYILVFNRLRYAEIERGRPAWSILSREWRQCLSR